MGHVFWYNHSAETVRRYFYEKTTSSQQKGRPAIRQMAAMILQNIQIAHLGQLEHFTADLSPEVNILSATRLPELAAAIDCLLCREVDLPPAWLSPHTRLTGRVLLNQKLYTVSATPREDRLTLTATDEAGCDATDRYQNQLQHCPEQNTAERFDGQDKTLPRLLWNWEQPLSRRAGQLADTRFFRVYLNQFIKTFQPEPINQGKPYLATLSPQGEFQAVLPGFAGPVELSETEEKLFFYICFLHIARFWADMEKLRDLHHEKKPLVIRNFLEHLDEATDISALMDRTAALQRQVIILTLPRD